MAAPPPDARYALRIAPRCGSRWLPKCSPTACVVSFCAGLVCLMSCGRVPEPKSETTPSRVVEGESLGDVSDAEQTKSSDKLDRSNLATRLGLGSSPVLSAWPGGTEDMAEKSGADSAVSSAPVKLPGGGWRLRLGSERHHRAVARRSSVGHLSTECSSTAVRSDHEVMGGVE